MQTNTARQTDRQTDRSRQAEHVVQATGSTPAVEQTHTCLPATASSSSPGRSTEYRAVAMAWVPDTNWMRPKAASAPNTSANTCTGGIYCCNSALRSVIGEVVCAMLLQAGGICKLSNGHCKCSWQLLQDSLEWGGGGKQPSNSLATVAVA